MIEEIELLSKFHLVNAEKLVESEQTANKRIAELPGADLIPDRRVCKLEYRGRSFSHKAKSLADEIDMRYMTVLKSMAVNAGDMDSLHCEVKLVTGGPAGAPGQISEGILGRCRAARQMANNLIGKLDNKSGPNVLRVLNRHKKALTLSDNTFWVEILFLSGLCGHDGELALQNAVLDALPEKGPVKSIAAVLLEAKLIMQSDLFSFCEEAAQANVKDITTKLQHLSEGRNP